MNTSSPLVRIGLVVALLAAIVGFQLAGSAAASSDEGAGTGRVLGRTAFAYLGGLRTFGAAVLWNRIEPVFHEYYSGVGIKDQLYMVPTLRMVTVLDPHFAQAYYVSSYIVFKNDRADEGIAIAREGVRQNPTSGLLRANLVQLLMLDDTPAHRAEALKVASGSFGQGIDWATEDELFEGLVQLRSVYEKTGDRAQVDRINATLQKLKTAGAGQGDHDHDGDGVQDH